MAYNPAYFTGENTDGYSAADLSSLNRSFRELLSVYYPGLPSYGEAVEVQDGHSLDIIQGLGERLLAAYDDGKRGVDLVNCVGQG